MSLNIKKIEDMGVYVCINSVSGEVFSFIGYLDLLKRLKERWWVQLGYLEDRFTEEEIDLIAESDDSIVCASCGMILSDEMLMNTTCGYCKGEAC